MIKAIFFDKVFGQNLARFGDSLRDHRRVYICAPIFLCETVEMNLQLARAQHRMPQDVFKAVLLKLAQAVKDIK